MLKYLVMAIPLLSVGIWAVWPLLSINDQEIPSSLWVLVVISAFANLEILYFHYTTPPHPKFQMLKERRIWLFIHVVSGSLEFLLGVLLLLLPGKTWPGLLMAITALFFHVPSSFAQNRIVAGSRAIMIPTYITGISAHGFAAAMLLIHPDSVFWAVHTFLLFNTYAWVRIYGFIFQKLELFTEGSRYTVMVLLAGVTTMTPMLGLIWPVQLAIFLTLYILLYRHFFAKERGDYINFVRDHDRWTSISKEAAELWSDKKDGAEQRDKARQVFEHFAEDGFLRKDTLGRLLSAWSLPPTAFAALVPAAEAGIDFETFFSRVWSLASVRNRASLAADISSLQSIRDKAQFTFNMLDLDNDGYLQQLELELLLLEWNLPPGEVQKYIEVSDSDGDGKINFDDFYRRMQPVWKYLFYNVLSTQMFELNLLSAGQAPTDKNDKSIIRKNYQRIKDELVHAVSFLQGAEPEFLKDVAESLEEKLLAPGETLFLEWDTADRFYIIVEGQLQLTQGGAPLCVLESGASFGETALLSDSPRAASVAAISSCFLYSLSRSSFNYLIERYPAMKTTLSNISTAYRQERILNGIRKLFRAQEGLFDVSTPELFEFLVSRCVDVRFRAGEVIIRQGDNENKSFYIIHSGLLSIRINDAEFAQRVPGECVGEMALLAGAPRNASVIALQDTLLFCLDEEHFGEALQSFPELAARLRDLLRKRAIEAGLPDLS